MVVKYVWFTIGRIRKKNSPAKQIQGNSGMFAADFLLWVGCFFTPVTNL